MSLDVLLLSVQTLKDKSSVHLNCDDKLILPEIKAAQDEHLVPALGTALFERLQAGVRDSDLNGDETTLLDSYITDTLINYVLAGLPIATGFQFFTKGVVRNTGDNMEQPSMSDLVEVSQHYKNRAEYYRERLIRYIQVNEDLFPEYNTTTDNDIDPIKSGYTIPIWLGDDDPICDES